MTSARATISWPRKPASLLSASLFHLSSLYLLLFLHLIHVSDSASVQISGDDDVILESLASSQILMDRSSPVHHTTPLFTSTLSSETTQLGLSSTEATTTAKENIKDNLSGNKDFFNSPLHVAQCRASCIQKFAETTPGTAATEGRNPPASVIKITTEENKKKRRSEEVPSFSPKTARNEQAFDDEEDEIHLMPKILRLRRKKRSSLQLPLKKSTWSCSESSPECLSCWKSCQLFETLFGENNPINLFAQQKTGEKTNEATASEKFPHDDVDIVDDSGADQVNKQTKLGKKNKNKQSISKASCASLVDSEQCMAGCQVACSFYERLFTSKKGENERKSPAIVKGADPVVATNHENILKIVPGKLTWPTTTTADYMVADNLKTMKPVVYVVIQEYPDRKWRQIAQTTEEEFNIPKELTSAMRTKLRSIRILVVGPEGLISVYSSSNGSSEKIQEPKKKFFYKGNNSGKVVVVEEKKKEEAGTTAITLDETNDKENGNESDGYITPEQTTTTTFYGEIQEVEKSLQKQTNYITDTQKNQTDNDDDGRTGTKISANNSALPIESDSSQSVMALPGGVIQEPFHLKVVSLIHQRSLVLAELNWNPIGGNPNQEYLITWELTAGGLKGHLVTDSTSVTLSLWPDTTYQIQVEKFDQNLDSDGEQPVESSPSSLKSLPLIVDTTEASFPMGSSSALLHQNGEDDDEYEEHLLDEDEFSGEENGNESKEEEKPTHKSFMNLPNISLVLCIAVVSAMFVLLILTVVAYGWTRLRMASASSSLKGSIKKVDCCFSNGRIREGCCDSMNNSHRNICNYVRNCFTCSFEKEPQLLLSSQEDSPSETSSPFYYAVELKKSQQKFGRGSNKTSKMVQRSMSLLQNRVAGQADCGGMEAPVTPVAVISSSSSLSSGRTSDPACPLFHYYPYSNGHELSSSSTSPSSISYSQGNSMRMKGDSASVGDEGLIKVSEQGYTSSSCWLPTATCTNNSSAATNNPTAATSTSSPVTTSW